jgi:hypothetical protein
MYLGNCGKVERVILRTRMRPSLVHPPGCSSLFSPLDDADLPFGRLDDVEVVLVEVGQLLRAPLRHQVGVALRVERRRREEGLLGRTDVRRTTVAVALHVLDGNLTHGGAVADEQLERLVGVVVLVGADVEERAVLGLAEVLRATGRGQRNHRRLVEGGVLLGVALAVVVDDVAVAVEPAACALVGVVERQVVLVRGAAEAAAGERVERVAVGAVQHLAIAGEVREVHERLAAGGGELHGLVGLEHCISSDRIVVF